MAEGGDEAQATGATSGTPEVFISYASQDAAVANAVVAALESRGTRCWIAPRDVTPGEFYAGSIVHAIDGTRAIVLILSGSATVSPHVVREVERAASKRHPVISFRLDQAPLPADLEYFLNTSQWLDASGEDANRVMPKLVAAVRVAIGKPANPGVSAATTVAGPSPRPSYPSDNIRSRYPIAVAAGSVVQCRLQDSWLIGYWDIKSSRLRRPWSPKRHLPE